MFDAYLITSIFIAVSFILVGALTLSRNPSSHLNRYFMLFSSSLALWLIANFLASTSKTEQSTALIANRLTFIFGGLSTLSTLLFVKVLANQSFSKVGKLMLIISFVMVLLGGTALVVDSIEPDGSTYLITFGPMAILYFISVIGYAIAAVITLFKARKKAHGTLKSQINVIQMSFATGLAIILITNAIFPLVFGFYGLTTVGSFFSALFVIGISYAIIRHKLFDIRLIVARSLAYILLLASLVGLYGLVVFVVADAFLGETTFAQQVVPILTALLLAFTTPALRSLFDRITNRIFYRDAYDPQLFLDELNKILVSTIELDDLLQKTIEITEINLKTDFAVFYIRETSYFPRRIIGDSSKKFESSDINEVASITPHIHGKVIVSDLLEDEEPELQKILVKNNVSILIRLVATLDYDVEGVGYLLLGPKKSGNPYNKQDIQTLDIIANELVIAIQNALRFEEIEKFNATLQEKVDDATKKLKHTNDKLRALDETKDEFISMASHQLRTPLTSVKGYLSMVLEGDAGEIKEMQRKLLDQAFVSSQRMVYLIADLLNVSRLRTGKFVIEPVVSNLADLVEGEIGQLKETAAGRGLELTFIKPQDFPQLYLDETKIRQVVMNFTDNAIYYTPSGGHINVKLEDVGESIELTVNDDGMGVPKSEQPHLFSKFFRAGNAKKARPDGTGLGLFMAKKVIIAQGGSIIFKSQEGKGSTFGFSLPKVKLQPPQVTSQN